jgi:murein DD-endopeptidase MepM/ murein hydrolase activator NlpD
MLLTLSGLAVKAGGIGGGIVSEIAVPPAPEVLRTVQAAGAPGGLVAVGSGTEPAPAAQEQVAFRTHTVAEGESLGSIAEAYGVDTQYLIWNNPELGANPDMLLIGEQLLVPGTPGIVYHVALGDTLTGIAATYGIDTGTITSFAPNELESPDWITEGMVLVLPGGVPPAPPPPEPEPAPAPAEPAAPVIDAPAAVVSAPAPPPPAAPAFASSAYSVGFIWPVNGRLNSSFGYRSGSFHSGIDIGAPYGTAVAAAASGQVTLTVYGDYGYGNYIVVRHADGTQTLYAHLSAIYVSIGQYVGQGEAIGAVGCTGWCTGNHLHFEVKVGGGAVNPLAYLP